MKQRVTIGDVALAAGVSKQTVSRAINDKGEISVDTKERIMNVVRELGYRPNRLARAMNTQRTFMIGLVVPDITNPFFPEVARGVQDAALDCDYNVLLCNTDSRPEAEIQTLELLASQGADGIILFSGRIEDAVVTNFAAISPPIVSINRTFDHPSILSLLVNNTRGASLAVDHFVAQGHQHIAMLSNQDFSHSQVRRVTGFQQGFEQNNLSQPAHIIDGEATLDGGYQATKELFAQHPKTTAIFAYNDLMAIGAIRACHDLGKTVPADVSVIGFDDIQLASMTSPALSTVSVDKYAIGRKAFKYLFQRIHHPDQLVPANEIDVKLTLRETTQQKDIVSNLNST